MILTSIDVLYQSHTTTMAIVRTPRRPAYYQQQRILLVELAACRERHQYRITLDGVDTSTRLLTADEIVELAH